jgi:glycosyltransferase involved in cell wall biosynthesis
MSKPRLCLNMIVRNEAARIEPCLRSVAPHINAYCILDTGSTDDTIGIISRFFADRNIYGWMDGWMDRAQFVDFATSRNLALDFGVKQSSVPPD